MMRILEQTSGHFVLDLHVSKALVPHCALWQRSATEEDLVAVFIVRGQFDHELLTGDCDVLRRVRIESRRIVSKLK